MKKKFGKIAAVLSFLFLLALSASACAIIQETQTLTELLLEVNSLPKVSAEGEVYISIHDRGMEEDFEQEGIPSDLLQNATIKYQIDSDNEAKLCKINLTGDFPCYDEPISCTFYVTPDYIYFNAQDCIKLCQIFASQEDYIDIQKQLVGYDWLAYPLEEYYNELFYEDFSDKDMQQLLDEIELFRNTVGQAYADFSVKAMTAKGNSFRLELDNAGLADLINEFITYTIDNCDDIAQACIAYINSSNFFDPFDRENLVETVQEVAEHLKTVTLQERLAMLVGVETALNEECPMDFNFIYDFAKTAADTYTLDEQISIIFDDEYYGESSDVLIAIKNTSKAANDLQIKLPGEKILWLDEFGELENDLPAVKADI